jgi:hypothetical protein
LKDTITPEEQWDNVSEKNYYDGMISTTCHLERLFLLYAHEQSPVFKATNINKSKKSRKIFKRNIFVLRERKRERPMKQ